MNATFAAIQQATDDLLPKPLPTSLPPVAPFDSRMLPEAVRDYVMDVADRQQSPPDFVAVATICGLAALLGRKLLIRPKQNDDWTVTPNQWGIIIGRPSAMKSPSIKEALRPLDNIERQARQQQQQESKAFAAESKLCEFERKEVELTAKGLFKEGKRQQALKLLAGTETKKLPTRQRIIVNDTTVEKLGELLNENANGLLLVRDELAGWLSKLAQDDYQVDRAFYLECFDGNGRYTYDRIGRGTIEIENCTLSLVGGIQPSKLAQLVRAAIRGTVDDGLVQRLQLAVWPDDPGSWRWRDRAPNAQARERFDQAFEKLHGLPFPAQDKQPPIWRFTAAAQTMFVDWMERLQAQARRCDIHPALESHLLKMPQTVAGLALLFEVLDDQSGSVGEVATARAMDWAYYLSSHAERIYSMSSNGGVEGARLIHERRDKLPSFFTSRDVQRKGWIGLDSPEAVRDALDTLVDYQHLMALEVPSSTQGGRPTTRYTWHPSLVKM
ncbi:YfjI family protein [Halomonas sp. I5-271120]|uniref:YfjI family protein n=1 Tax=Halomonas sp. I5-271120 TaxID=3061632 RepID=UPI0027149E85|nr:YfjI family protein [Halomonas sp. I5-271120]